MRKSSVLFSAYCVRVVIASLLWIYAGVVIFVWFSSLEIPVNAVLVRIVNHGISDVIWIPFGVVIWSVFFIKAGRYFFPHIGKCISFLLIWSSIVVAVMLLLFLYDVSFRFFVIPLFVILVVLMRKFHKINILESIFLYGPGILLIFATVIYYQWQLFPRMSFYHNGCDIKVMSYNIGGDISAINRLRIIDTIRSETPDIVCCMEYNSTSDSTLFEKELGSLYPYSSDRQLNSWVNTDELILARFPFRIISFPSLSDESSPKVKSLFVTMTINGDAIIVASLHLPTVGQYLKWISEYGKTLKEKRVLFSRFEGMREEERFNEARTAFECLPESNVPIIICGDLNSTPNSSVFHMFSKRFLNVFSLRGWGLGDTFGRAWMIKYLKKVTFINLFARDVVRIDHIFVSDHFRVLSAYVVTNAKGSDHKPVVTVIRLANTRQ